MYFGFKTPPKCPKFSACGAEFGSKLAKIYNLSIYNLFWISSATKWLVTRNTNRYTGALSYVRLGYVRLGYVRLY